MVEFFFLVLVLVFFWWLPIFILSLHSLTLTGSRNGNAETSSEILCFDLIVKVFQAQQEAEMMKTLQRSLQDKTKPHFFLGDIFTMSTVQLLATWKIWSFLNVKCSIKCPGLIDAPVKSPGIWVQAQNKPTFIAVKWVFASPGMWYHSVLWQGELKRLGYTNPKLSVVNIVRKWKKWWRNCEVSVWGQDPSWPLVRTYSLIFLHLHMGHVESQSSVGECKALVHFSLCIFVA